MSTQRTARTDFRAAVESADLQTITHTLQHDVEFHSPIVRRPYRGLDQVAPLLQILLEVLEDFRYTGDLAGRADDADAVRALLFTARVKDTTVQGLDLIRFGHAGLVSSLTVMVRPLPAAMTLARAVDQAADRLSGARLTGLP